MFSKHYFAVFRVLMKNSQRRESFSIFRGISSHILSVEAQQRELKKKVSISNLFLKERVIMR